MNAEENNKPWCLYLFLSPKTIWGIFRRLTCFSILLFLSAFLSNFVLFNGNAFSMYCYSVKHVNKYIYLCHFIKKHSPLCKTLKCIKNTFKKIKKIKNKCTHTLKDHSHLCSSLLFISQQSMEFNSRTQVLINLYANELYAQFIIVYLTWHVPLDKD